MSALEILSDYTSKTLNRFFNRDSNLVSDELVEIMTNEEDKKKYFAAIEKTRESKIEEEVKLTSGETLIVAP